MPSQESPERLLMFEFTMPYLQKESVSLVSAITSENARTPMLFIFFGITAFYQLYWKEGAPFNPNKKKDKEAKKGESEGEGMMNNFREHAKKQGKLTPQMEKDMAEIDAMMNSMNSFGDRVN